MATKDGNGTKTTLITTLFTLLFVAYGIIYANMSGQVSDNQIVIGNLQTEIAVLEEQYKSIKEKLDEIHADVKELQK